MKKATKELKSLKELTAQREAFEEFARSLHITSDEDWYKVTASSFKSRGGTARSVLNAYYNGSISASLANLYPEYYWKPWRFSQVS